jgi:hypothetical protein
MASPLRRATLVLPPAKPAPAAPVGELEAIPALGANLLARSANQHANDAVEAPTDILFRKGTATTSRWRSYDHKEAFEPAQEPTAPPSDADVMGSWLKYDGSVPVVTPLDQAVRDEELPTSWTKYDDKPPLASLLESRERLRKSPIYVAESAPPAAEQRAQPAIPAAPTSLDRAKPQPAPQPPQPAVAEAPVPAAPAESQKLHTLNPEPGISAAPIEKAPEEAPEPAPEAAAGAPETRPAEVPGESEAIGDLPLEVQAVPAPMPEAEAVPMAFVAEPPVLATPTEPMAAAPQEEPPSSEAPIEAAPAEPPVSQLVSAENSEPEAHAVSSAELPALPAEPEQPTAEIGEAWAPAAQAEAAPAVSAPEPEAAAGPMAAAEPPRAEAPIEPGLLASAVAVAGAAPSGTGPADQRELLQMAVTAIKKPGPAKKAMLTRLAGMLEQALSAKRSARKTSKPPVASEPETSAPSIGLAEPAPDAVQLETVAPPEPAGPLPEIAIPSAETAPAASEILAEPVMSAEPAIDPVPLATTGDAEAVPSEAFAPPQPTSPPPEMEKPAEAMEPAALEIAADAVVFIEAVPDPVPLTTIADADAVSLELFSPLEPAAPPLDIETPFEAAEPVVPEASPDAVVSIEAAPDPVLLTTTADADAARSEALAPAEPIAPWADARPEIAATPEPQRSVQVSETVAEPETELAARAITPDVEALAGHEVASGDTTASPLPETGLPPAPSAEDQAPLAADTAAYSIDRAIEPEPEAAAPLEAAPLTEAAAVEAAAAPVPLDPVTPTDEEKAARDALASDLADMIHKVLSTTQFATRATRTDRLFSVPSAQAGVETADLGEDGEIAADALPHPVAIKRRLGRMERVLALFSLGMIILVGYFAVSLWRDDGVVAAQAPVIAPRTLSSSDRMRDATRALGAAAIETPKSAVGSPPVGPRPVDRR